MEQIKKGGEQRWPIDDAGLRLGSVGTAEPRNMKIAQASLFYIVLPSICYGPLLFASLKMAAAEAGSFSS